MAQQLLPERVVPLPPRVPGARIRCGAGAPDGLRRVLAEHVSGLVLRESGEGTVAVATTAAETGDTFARRVTTLGLEVLDALPNVASLGAVHADAHPSRHRRPGLEPFVLRTSIVEVTGTRLIILLMTGSAAQQDEDLELPASLACAAFLDRFQPGLVGTPELTRMLRHPYALGDIARPFARFELQHGYPAWLCGDDDERPWHRDAMFLEPFSHKTEKRLFRAGERGREEARRTASRISGAIASAVPLELPMIDGRVRDPGSGPVMSGYTHTFAANAKGLRDHPIIYAEGDGHRPEPHEVAGPLPRREDTRGRQLPYPDMLDILRWVFRTADTPGWTDNHKIGKQLERLHYSTQGLRNENGQTATFISGHDADAKAIRRIMDHLESYFLRQMVRCRNGITWVITGLPWMLSRADYERLRGRWEAPAIRERRDTYLLTGLPLTADETEEGILQGRRRPRDNAIIFAAMTPDGRHSLGSRVGIPIPPVPQARILTAVFDTLRKEGATLTAPDPDQPDESELLAADVTTLRRSIAETDAAQRRRLRQLDPGADANLRPNRGPARVEGDDDAVTRDLKNLYNDVSAALETDRAKLRDDERRLARMLEEPPQAGFPVLDIWSLARAGIDEDDRTMRIPLLNAITDFHITRPRAATAAAGSNGSATAPLEGAARTPGTFQFTLTLIDDPKVGPRQTSVRGTYADRYQRSSTAHLRQLLHEMTAGTPLLHLTNGRRDLFPKLREALGRTTGPLRVLAIDNPSLLEMTMHACHPLLPDQDLTHLAAGGMLVGPPLDEDALEALAAERGWQLPLLRQIRHLHLNGTRTTADWLYRRAPRTAELYGQARRRGRIHSTADIRILLTTARTAPDWELDGRTATLLPCANCSRRRIHPSRLMEAVGGLCTNCWHDREMVHWTRRYAAYLE